MFLPNFVNKTSSKLCFEVFNDSDKAMTSLYIAHYNYTCKNSEKYAK